MERPKEPENVVYNPATNKPVQKAHQKDDSQRSPEDCGRRNVALVGGSPVATDLADARWMIPMMTAREASSRDGMHRSVRGDGSERVSIHEVMMRLAFTVSARSSCYPAGRRHGAVIAVQRRVVSMGYNGPPASHPHCAGCDIPRVEGGEKDFSKCPALHAEANSILSAASLGVSIAGGTMYVTKEPCRSCRMLVENSGVMRIVVPDPKEEEE